MKKVIVKKDLCIKCGACISICSEGFTFGEDGFATPLVSSVEEVSSNLQSAVESCPTSAIAIIDAP